MDDEQQRALVRADQGLRVVLSSPVLPLHNAIVLREVQSDVRAALGRCRHDRPLTDGCVRCDH